jgi:hypothetical protein
MVAPIYAPEDEWWEDVDGDGVKDPGETYQQGAMPAGALKGTQGNAITTGKSVYASETPVGSARIIQVMYMFPAYNPDGSTPYTGYAPIPSTTAAGTYTGGSVTVRIIAK